MRSDDVVVFDNLSGMLTLITHANPQEAGAFEAAYERLDDMLDDGMAMDPSAFCPSRHKLITKLIIGTVSRRRHLNRQLERLRNIFRLAT